MLLVGGLGEEFEGSVNHFLTRGQIMPITLLLFHPDLKTY
jgi:hypothetical protein